VGPGRKTDQRRQKDCWPLGYQEYKGNKTCPFEGMPLDRAETKKILFVLHRNKKSSKCLENDGPLNTSTRNSNSERNSNLKKVIAGLLREKKKNWDKGKKEKTSGVEVDSDTKNTKIGTSEGKGN